MATTETSPLRSAWKLKMGIIITVLVLGAAWFYLDASRWYPARGEKVARWNERQYLIQAAGGPDRPYSGRPEAVSVADPQAEYQRLRERADSGMQLTSLEERRLEWLRALSHVGRLDPALTTYGSQALGEPGERLAELDAAFAGVTSAPKPLSRYDIAFQWGGVALLAPLAIYMIGFVTVVSRRRFHWEPESQTLTLPGGESITPQDIEEVDKRKWDKFFVFLKIRRDHPRLGGKTLKIDLYRRDRVEDWILEMERTRFPELVAQEEAEKAAAEEAQAQEAAPQKAGAE